MDTGTATMGMCMVLMETTDMERTPREIMATAIMVMFMETMDMGTTGMVTITKRTSKIRDTPTAEAVETLSRCPSVRILSLFRSSLKTHSVFYTVVIFFAGGTKLIAILMHFYVVVLL